ncbi:hypothetical protein CI102_10791 [Trichoderma harzianum]|uniref:Uncharacterized protein n=1 Tax=Trichoderma harzianum CBS 226.95 TaxID=983964 RepID=A0A2T4A2S0_TRIHA|nr:hypothetical protein M431DRAFT_238905 [Trichoderma harzianum CBS 226.95]PKK43299.1 hypothetical protein CI102_10791 [Trichoderma harzianum]PTB51273.1 hypothetical protein M431DRAFT_238905 [Trichoderma harzianum CBS 226.95]
MYGQVLVPPVRADEPPWYLTTFGGAARCFLLVVRRRSCCCVRNTKKRTLYASIESCRVPGSSTSTDTQARYPLRWLRLQTHPPFTCIFFSSLFQSPSKLNLILVLYTVLSCMCCTLLLLDFCIVLPSSTTHKIHPDLIQSPTSNAAFPSSDPWTWRYRQTNLGGVVGEQKQPFGLGPSWGSGVSVSMVH